MRVFKLLVTGFLFSSFLSCGGSSATTVTVSGTVVNGLTGAALTGVTVSDGTTSVQTNSDGTYSLEATVSDSTGRLSLNYSATSFMRNQRVTQVGRSSALKLDEVLLPVTVSAEINPTVDQTVVVPGSAAQVVVSANSLVDSSGTAVSGTVTANVTPIDPSSDPTLMPGDYAATLSDGTSTKIESFGALDVTFEDASGNSLNLAAGTTATIRIAIPAKMAQNNPPASIPLFYFNTSTGLWIEQGTATLQGTAPLQYYEGTVSHFTTWNADRRTETSVICGHVVNTDGSAISLSDGDSSNGSIHVSSIKVHSEGVDYVSYDESAENWELGDCSTGWGGLFFGCIQSDGSFKVSAKADAAVKIFVEAVLNGKTHRTNTITVTAGAAATTSTACVTNLSSDNNLVFDMTNAIPIISSLSADPTATGLGSLVTLVCKAKDGDGDTLSYSWSWANTLSDTDPDKGTLSSETGASVTWTPPASAGYFSFTCAVSDGKTTVTKSTNVNVVNDHMPVITAVTADSSSVTAGGTVALSCSATDEDVANTLNYFWDIAGGSMSSMFSASPTWTAPSTNGTYKLSCTASDALLNTEPQSVSIEVTGGSSGNSGGNNGNSGNNGGGGNSGNVPQILASVPTGGYLWTMSGSVTMNGQTTAIPSQSLGTFTFNPDDFVTSMTTTFSHDTSAYSQYGCSTSVSYTAYDGTSFSATFSLTGCNVSGYAFSESITYTFTKQ
ncbi:MAG: hypothetical protein HQM15_05440 [Deltaproteobacteria bacterium]|nr:hypothetical protein [Deltaproteobacteria bacterium]